MVGRFDDDAATAGQLRGYSCVPSGTAFQPPVTHKTGIPAYDCPARRALLQRRDAHAHLEKPAGIGSILSGRGAGSLDRRDTINLENSLRISSGGRSEETNSTSFFLKSLDGRIVALGFAEQRPARSGSAIAPPQGARAAATKATAPPSEVADEMPFVSEQLRHPPCVSHNIVRPQVGLCHGQAGRGRRSASRAPPTAGGKMLVAPHPALPLDAAMHRITVAAAVPHRVMWMGGGLVSSRQARSPPAPLHPCSRTVNRGETRGSGRARQSILITYVQSFRSMVPRSWRELLP